MFINNHLFFIIKKYSLNIKIKKINFGTNSISMFFKKNKNIFFLSIIKLKKIKIFNLKIFQNKFFNISKIICFTKNIVIYKKNLGIMISFPNFNNFVNLIKKKNFLKKIKKKKKFFFLNLYNVNLFSKILYCLKERKIYNSLFNHNDLFKDNIIFFGNIISSIIDYNNYSYCKSEIDFFTIYYELSFNYKILFFILIENYGKMFLNNKKKYILKITFFRFLKILKFKKSKSISIYIKKFFFNEIL